MSRVEVIGDCTLYLGDCRDVLGAQPAQSVDMILTDPPYGNSNNEGDLNAAIGSMRGYEVEAIANDDQASMRAVVGDMLLQGARVLRKTSALLCFCSGGGQRGPTFAWLAQRMDEGGLYFFHSLIWDKVNTGLGWRYRRQYEMVMIAHRARGKILWADPGRSHPNIVKMPAPAGFLRRHPNEKPEALMRLLLEIHAPPGAVVCDPFMGSGTTGVAAVQLGLSFVGVELDARHFDTACRRIEEAVRQPRLALAAPARVVQEALI